MASHPIGILLAAGRGRRMGCLKQLLPWPPTGASTTLVAAAFDSIAGVCQSMVVVVGDDRDAIKTALHPRSFTIVNSDSDAEMSHSLRMGLAAACRVDPAAPALLQPADHPSVAQSTLVCLSRHLEAHPRQAIIPEYDARGGHPVLMPVNVIQTILDTDIRNGLKHFWRQHPQLCHRVQVNDPNIIRDIDTPEDYEK